MPTYQYECEACAYSFEAYQSITEAKMKKCPKCSKLKLHRLVGTGGGIIFKGSGFYQTDYKNSGNKPAAKKNDSKPSTSSPK